MKRLAVLSILAVLASCTSTQARTEPPPTTTQASLPTSLPNSPPGKPLFQRRNTYGVLIVGTLFPKGCNQLWAQFAQDDQNASLAGPGAPITQELLQVVSLGPDWLTVHSGPGVADVRWIDTGGHHDGMHPVKGWSALAGIVTGEPSLSLNSTLIAYDATGHELASQDIGKPPLPDLNGNLCR